ncbi:Replicase polyprotein 1ab [Micromonospora sp. WMMD1082]|uniref:Replicase polyprotein 1ab n=1 Tax=Micromonospora sp. WMMD1082 TaxID=3016104 RepID=UPI0024171722|nr:Replicase polyprotein 1ab [Micromonospora sp. WMMD1082]MDG4798403.1 Replicase polyprotein 1ab [Micromonospora sp. WMMD1082]
MAKPVADTVARHLVATGQLIDEDPAEALAHALAARRLASRIAAVREAVGLASYHAGQWQSAIAELRTYHRMTGAQSHLAVIADSERALGRPERAIDLFRGADQEKLDPAVAIELLIVAAGARGDLGQRDAAVAMLQVRELTTDAVQPWTARLRYAYADALLAVGRRTEAREWFSRAAEVDTEAETDAAERLLDLDGVVIEGDDEDEVAEELAAGPGAPGAVPARPDADLSADAVGEPNGEDPAEAGPAAVDPAGDEPTVDDDPAGDELTVDYDPTGEELVGDELTVGNAAIDDDLAGDDRADNDPAGDELVGDELAAGSATGGELAADGEAIDGRAAEGEPVEEARSEVAAKAVSEVDSSEDGDRREDDGPEEPEAQRQ